MKLTSCFSAIILIKRQSPQNLKIRISHLPVTVAVNGSLVPPRWSPSITWVAVTPNFKVRAVSSVAVLCVVGLPGYGYPLISLWEISSVKLCLQMSEDYQLDVSGPEVTNRLKRFSKCSRVTCASSSSYRGEMAKPWLQANHVRRTKHRAVCSRTSVSNGSIGHLEKSAATPQKLTWTSDRPAPFWVRSSDRKLGAASPSDCAMPRPGKDQRSQ